MRITNNRSTAFLYLLIIICFYQLSFKIETTPSLTVTFRDELLSLEGKAVEVEDIFMEISKKCGIEIKNYEEVFITDPININFSDLKLKDGIKKIIKAGGIKNHSVLYKEVNPGHYQIYAIDFLGEGKVPIVGKYSLEPFKKVSTQTQATGDVKEKNDSSEMNFMEKMEAFEDKYEWDNNNTQELAVHLLNRMPERFRDTGLDEVIKKLDKRIEERGKDGVDEETFLEAVEETLPRKIAHREMSRIKKHINEFKGEEMYELTEEILIKKGTE